MSIRDTEDTKKNNLSNGYNYKEIQVSTKVTQQKEEPDLPPPRDLIQQIKEEIIREAKKDLSNLFLVERSGKT